jgi:hypothetical protein
MNLNSWRQENFEKFYKITQNRLQDRDELLNRKALAVKVVAIPEPGKFRIITKGDGYLYSILQPLQGALLSSWKTFYASTMLDDDLSERINQIDQSLPDLDFWCSVDYEAATDLIKRAATLAVYLNLTGIPLFTEGLVSLFPGTVIYPQKFADTEDGRRVPLPAEKITGVEGQLMGHPLSFPILCTVNIAVYHCALDRWVALGHKVSEYEGKRRFKILDLAWNKVLVNGDDMVFKCERGFYEVFLETASAAGFKISVGKNFLSPDTCMINSQLFRRKNNRMKRFGYLNLKIVTGHNLKDGDSDAIPTQLSRSLNDMVKRCKWTRCVIPETMNRWSDDFYGKCYRPNWYLPVHLGGLGVDIKYAPYNWKVTRDQREMAARFISDPRMQLYRVPGVDLPTAEFADVMLKWRIVIGDYVRNINDLSTQDSDEWLQRIAYASRARSGSVKTNDEVFISKFKPQYRLDPMSIEGLVKYWRVRLIAHEVPPCPPLLGLKKVRFGKRLLGTDFDRYGNVMTVHVPLKVKTF